MESLIKAFKFCLIDSVLGRQGRGERSIANKRAQLLQVPLLSYFADLLSAGKRCFDLRVADRIAAGRRSNHNGVFTLNGIIKRTDYDVAAAGNRLAAELQKERRRILHAFSGLIQILGKRCLAGGKLVVRVEQLQIMVAIFSFSRNVIAELADKCKSVFPYSAICRFSSNSRFRLIKMFHLMAERNGSTGRK